jgi:WD40 repeat protein
MTRVMTGQADGVIWLWDLSSSKKIMAFSGHEVALRAVMMSPDRKFAVSQDEDQNILLWRLPD